MAQLAWTTQHVSDIASDLSALHRVDDWRTLDGPRYFELALRLPYYGGVLGWLAAVDLTPRRAHGAREQTTPPAQPAQVSDTLMLAQLAAEGWGEHVVETAG
jgi:hypothetical protein